MIAFPRIRFPTPVGGSTLALITLLLAALALRVYGLNWDDGHYLHPDERYIAIVAADRIHLSWPLSRRALLDPRESGLNPRSADPKTGRYREFPYGALPLFVTDSVAEAVNRLSRSATDWHEYGHIYVIGRSISAVLDTLTVLVIYLIGQAAFSRSVGLIAAAVAALAPMSIQLAHFFTTDSWLTFFVSLSLLCAIRAGGGGKVRWYAAAGATFGLAMATKGSVFTLAGLLAVSTVYDIWRRSKGGTPLLAAIRAAAWRGGVAAVAAVTAFALFEPYALANPGIYIRSLRQQADIVSGSFDVPYTRQYIGTTRVVYQIAQLVRWGLGPVSGTLALLGLLVLGRRCLQRRGAAEILILAWLLGYGLVVAVPETKFLRYLAPLTPVLALSAGLALDWVIEVVGTWKGRRLAASVAAASLAGAALWTTVFASVYAHPNSRIVASQWMYVNVPAGSSLSAEYWDDALPLSLAPGPTGEDRRYRTVTFDLYQDYPSLDELRRFADALQSDELLRPAAEAIGRGDEQSAGNLLRGSADAAAQLAAVERNHLAAVLDDAASRLTSPATGELGDATRETAAALRRQRSGPATQALAPADAIRHLADVTQATIAREPTNVIYRDLDEVDYVILSSNRLSSSIPRSPWRYPVQTRYYQLLAGEQLGFRLVKEVHRYPQLGPLIVNDQGADESFTVYDHPRVLIYKKERLIERPEFDALMASAAEQPVVAARHAPAAKLTFDRPVEQLPVVSDARWSERWTHHSIVALLVWLGLLGLLQVAGWPLACLVCARFGDAGWGLARLITLLTSGYLVWIGASLDAIAFRAVWAAAALFLVGGGGWLTWRRSGALRRVWSLRPGQRRVVAASEIAFWSVFGVFLLLRYLNPDSWHPYWGGEKPMEFAHINAILRSSSFPPVDPWYAGGYINYYYYGLYLVAFLFKLTGIPSEIGFNLAQPTVMALLASTGFSVASTLGRDGCRRARAAIPTGLLGVVLLVGIGNLNGLVAFGRKVQGLVADPFIDLTWNPSRAIHLPSGTDAITEFPLFTGLYADLHAHVVALPITVLAIGLGYALASDPGRLAAAIDSPVRAREAVLIVGAQMAVLGLTIGTLYPTNAWDVPTYLALGGVAVLMATSSVRRVALRGAVALGGSLALAVIAYGLYLPFHRHYVAMAGSVSRVAGPTDLWQFGSHLGGLLAIVGLGLIVVALSRTDGAPRAFPPPLLPFGILAGFAVLHRAVPVDDDRLREALTLAFVVMIVATLGAAAWSASDGGPRLGRLAVARIGVAVGLCAILALLVKGQVTLGFLLGVTIAAGAVWLFGATLAERYLGLMAAAACLVGAGVELVVISDRVNTIFKFYNQIWVLLALSGAALVARMAGEAKLQRWVKPRSWLLGNAGASIVEQASLPTASSDERENAGAMPVALQATAAWARAGLGVTAIVVATSLFYPYVAISPRLHQRFTTHLGSGTLNGLDWMNYGTLPSRDGDISFRGDRGAIDWLNANVHGTPVVAEASIGSYRGNGTRIAVATGLPTIIGWEYHESQQRYPETLPQRVADVRMLYDSPDPAAKLAILRRYNVRYVVAGDVERKSRLDGARYASPEGIDTLKTMIGTSLDVVFDRDGTTIYQVRAAAP